MVRELVLLFRGRDVLDQQLAALLDALDESIARVARLHMCNEVRDDLLPALVGYVLADPPVCEDLDVVLRFRDEDQEAGVALRMMEVLIEKLAPSETRGTPVADN